MSISLLIVGQVKRAEAKPLAEWLATALQPADTKHFTDLTTALSETWRTNWIPDLIVIVQSWPDEFSPSEIASLFAFAPLARVVVAYGAWCESDGRNRHLWPLAVRVPLRSAAARIEREWRLLHEERGLELLPLSASREEVFAADHPPLAKTSLPETVLVASPDPAYRRYLNDLLVSAGHIICPIDEQTSGSQPTVVLFDADPWNEAQADQLRSLCRRHPTASTIALMSLPLPEHGVTIVGLGASAVLPKLGDQSNILDAMTLAAITPASRPAGCFGMRGPSSGRGPAN